MDLAAAFVKRVKDHGESLKEICLADTIGIAAPEQVRSLVRNVRKACPEAEVSLHLHDTRGTGIANVYAGLLEGVSIFEGSVGGMGGCPFMPGAAGNVATEEIVYLCHESGISTGVLLGKYIEAAKVAEQIIGHTLPGKLYRSGASV